MVIEERSGLVGPIDPFDVDIEVRMRGVERQHQLDDRVADQEADRQSGSAGRGAPDPLPRGVGARQQRQSVLEELTPGQGQLDVATRPDQQAGAELLLQLANLPAQHRLADRQAIGGLTEMEFLGQRDEIAQPAKVEIRMDPAGGRPTGSGSPVEAINSPTETPSAAASGTIWSTLR